MQPVESIGIHCLPKGKAAFCNVLFVVVIDSGGAYVFVQCPFHVPRSSVKARFFGSKVYVGKLEDHLQSVFLNFAPRLSGFAPDGLVSYESLNGTKGFGSG